MVTLTGRTQSGEAVSIPIAQEIRFAAARTHVTVAINVPYEMVRRYGLSHPAI